MVIDNAFWKQQNVFITGHTGFKGSWLSLLLSNYVNNLVGFSDAIPTNPSLYDRADLQTLFKSDFRGDIADLSKIRNALLDAKPNIIFHLAAQPLVIDSYENPLRTYLSNTMGTANLLEAARDIPSIKKIIVITTDKCYQNTNKGDAYSETDHLGGHDPYSASKACAELISSSYRSSFYNSSSTACIATARAGNVIGGGDWADNRLIPDCFKAFSMGKPLELRNPHAIRPWQHVLEPLYGYILLAQKLNSVESMNEGIGWNFGPHLNDELNTEEVAMIAKNVWGEGNIHITPSLNKFKETDILRLNSSKSNTMLKWQPRWDSKTAVEKTMEWYKLYHQGNNPRAITMAQIDNYFASRA